MQKQDIPEIEILDLEDDIPEPDDPNDIDTKPHKDRKKLPVNIHIVLLAVAVVTISVILYKYLNWGQIVEPEENPSEPEDYTVESYDNILPLTDEEGNVILPDLEDGLSIAIFGNGLFTEDRDSEDGAAAMLAKATGATVYNCSINGSHLASTSQMPDMNVDPWDAFSLYWMSLFSTKMKVRDFMGQAADALGADLPPEVPEVREILSSLDFSKVDVIVIMYDAADYFAGRPAYETGEHSALQTFAGSLDQSLKILNEYYPDTRIIVMSPTYAFSDQLDENGDYISSDIMRYGEDGLATYVTKAAEVCAANHVTFVDNFYVTFNEDNASDYLSDHVHLNAEGRKRVIERLLYALNYFGNIQGTTSGTPVSR